MRKFLLSMAVATTVMATAGAQNALPQFSFTYPDGKQLVEMLSDNGQWAVTQGAATEEGTLQPTGGTLYHLPDMAKTPVAADTWAGVSDVTDDGKIVVGEYEGLPAYWQADSKTWTKLAVPARYPYGRLTAVSADGKIAVGYAYIDPATTAYQPLAFDLTTGQAIDTPNLPVFDMAHEESPECVFTGISGDGRYVVGRMSASTLQPVSMFTFIYDMNTKTYKVMGFTESETQDWTPAVEGLYFLDGGVISPNGRWVAGLGYMLKGEGGTDDKEYHITYRYDMQNGTFEVYDAESDHNIGAKAVCDDGTIVAASPFDNPYPTCMVRVGKYFYSLEQVLRQKYGVDFFAKTGQVISGYPFSVSADGRILTGGTTVGGWTVSLPDPLSVAAADINLLENYTAAPASGSSFSVMQNVTVTFDRAIAVAGKASDIKFQYADGTAIRNATGANVDASGTKLSISFRSTDLQDGKNYRVVIPAGIVTIKGDTEMKNNEIILDYNGITPGHIVMTESYPADDATIAKLDLNSSYVLLTFNATVAKGDDSKAYLYREGQEDPIATLSTGVQNNQALIYPTNGTQYLYDGTHYRIVVPAGAFRDASGYSPNEEITLRLHGSYVREIDADDTYIFHSDCSDYQKFMFYMGNFNEPSSVVAGWGFTAQTPVVAVADDTAEESNLAYATHSMYTPAGESDTWIVTPQLFIPDGKCYLSFKAQSYLKSKQDRLRVYIYTSEENVNDLTPDFVGKIRATTPVVDAILTPGASEESLAGDWQDFDINLKDYAGKHIYVAFSNNNNDQSAIFLDDIEVSRDLKYLVSFTNDDRVVARSSMPITGAVTVNNPGDPYTTLSMRLLDADGQQVSTIKEENISLGKGDHYNFTFPQELPLTTGIENKFTLEATLGADVTSVQGSVKCLAFAPVKRVLLEEYSGMGCSNCPRGFVAVDKLLETYPGRVLPVIIRTYGGDPLGSGLGDYSQFLGLDAIGAPCAIIGREYTSGPMLQDSKTGHYVFSASDLSAPENCGNPRDSWFDAATSQLAVPCDAGISAVASYDATTGEVVAYGTLTYAMDAQNQNLSVFTVFTEDQVETNQSNGMARDESPAMGQWGANGIYNKPFVNDYLLDHVARGFLGDNMSYNGTPGLLPSSLRAGEPCKFTITGSLPGNIEDWQKAHLNIIIIDNNTDKVVNGVRTALTDVNSVIGITDDAVAPADVYNLLGVRVLRNATPEQIRQLPAGLYISRGRKIVVK